MLTYALIAFALTAVGGLILAAHVLRDKFAPWVLSLLHAAFGALGLVLLIILFVQGSASQAVLIGLVLLLLAPLPPDTLSLVLDGCGFLSLVFGGWLGGKLVYEHGIGRRKSAAGK